MEWAEEGICLSARRHGESAAILEVLTAAHGRHAGVVRGGAGRRLAPVLQPGAQLALNWRARLDTHIGAFTVEPLRARAPSLMHDAERLAALNAFCALALFALPEREPQPRLYAAGVSLLEHLAGGAAWYDAYLGWELLLLEESGYGLDLSACALSGAREGLAFVSPKTGRAVTATAAGDYAPRLLPLPAMMTRSSAPVSDPRAEMRTGLRVSGHFLAQVLAPALGERPLPAARARLAARFDQAG